MKLILYQATMAITEIDFVPGPFRCQIEQQHLDFAVVRTKPQKCDGSPQPQPYFGAQPRSRIDLNAQCVRSRTCRIQHRMQK